MELMPEKQEQVLVKELEAEETDQASLWNVVLLDDDDHTVDYVVEMLMAIFGHDARTALVMTIEVDTRGRVIVFTTDRDEALDKRRQIESWGADWRLPFSKGSMGAVIEPAHPYG